MAIPLTAMQCANLKYYADDALVDFGKQKVIDVNKKLKVLVEAVSKIDGNSLSSTLRSQRDLFLSTYQSYLHDASHAYAALICAQRFTNALMATANQQESQGKSARKE